jgi:hypothetical protein
MPDDLWTVICACVLADVCGNGKCVVVFLCVVGRGAIGSSAYHISLS